MAGWGGTTPRAARIVAALIALSGCGGAPPRAVAHARPVPVARQAKAARAAAVDQDPEAALIAMLEKIQPEVLREAAAGPQRTQVTPVSLRLADLPIVHTGPMLDPKLAPSSLRDVDPPRDLSVRPSGRRAEEWGPGARATMLGTPDFKTGEVQVGKWAGRNGDLGQGQAIEIPCGGDQTPGALVLPARWEGLATPSPTRRAATAEYTIVDGWFDRAACKAGAVRRVSAPANEIVPGVMYAFRTCGPSCSEDEALAIVLPTARSLVTNRSDPARQGALTTRVSLPLRRGTAESMVAYVIAPAEKRQPARGLVVGVEVTQGIQDPEPVAVMFVQPAPQGEIPVPDAIGDEG